MTSLRRRRTSVGWGLSVALGLLGTGCGGELPVSQVTEQGGLVYREGDEEPWTGGVVEPFPESTPGVAKGVFMRRSEYRGGVLHGTLREWAPAGVLILEKEMMDGKANGSVRSWYPSGLPRDSAGFAADALDGVLRRWFESGQLRLEQEFRRGHAHGAFREWSENGQVIAEGTYADGTLHGLVRRWHPNGRPALEGEFHRGRSESIRMWDPEGEPIPIQPDIVLPPAP